MKILITGTAGFIGFHTTKLLLKQNHSIIGIDNLNDYYDVNLKLSRLNQLKLDDKIINHKLNYNASFNVSKVLSIENRTAKIFINEKFTIFF